MRISRELSAQILRLYEVERWRVGTIARQLQVHHATVRRVLAQAGVPATPAPLRQSRIDPFRPFILQTLAKYPTLTAARLLAMVQRARLSRRALALSPSDCVHASTPGGAGVPAPAFGGIARVLLYDNLKSAVLERVGDAIRFHPTLLDFAGHHRYVPRPVVVARAFFAARSFTNVADLNAQAHAWCTGQASNRPWPEDDRLTERQAFEIEQASLLGLPQDDYPLGERIAVKVGKTPYVRFDWNDYSTRTRTYGAHCTSSPASTPCASSMA